MGEQKKEKSQSQRLELFCKKVNIILLVVQKDHHEWSFSFPLAVWCCQETMIKCYCKFTLSIQFFQPFTKCQLTKKQ
jgi:hypothetical protein